MELDINSNRKTKNYSIAILFIRVIWSFAGFFFKNSPRVAFGFRNLILRLFGAKIGKNVNVYSSATITFPWNLTIGDWSAIGENAKIYSVGKIVLGKKVTISQNAHLCAASHDFTDSSLPIVTKSIIISDQSWIAADAFIGPGVTIGEGAVVGARSAVFKNVEPWTVVGGNPAKFIKKREITK